MNLRPLSVRFLPLLLGALLATGCAPKGDPAEQAARTAIDQIDGAVEAAGVDAIKYLPGKVAAVKGQANQLKIMYYDKEYDGIAKAAPEILERAQSLATAAAAKKAEIAAMLAKDWTELETGAPAALTAVEQHVDALLAAKTLPAGVDKSLLENAKIGIAELRSLWEKALAAKAAGDIEQAVTAGSHVERRAENLKAALTPAPGATP
jgi:hypothetical protein